MTIPDRVVVAAAAAIAAAVWRGSALVGALAVVAAALCLGVGGRRRAAFWLIAAACASGAGVRADRAWSGLEPDVVGPYLGWSLVVDDPQPLAASTRVILEVGGERFEYWARGRAAQLRARSWRAGERVVVSGERRALDAARARRVAWQHVVGRFDLQWAGDVVGGAPVATASNRVRATLERAAATMPPRDGALYRGLVIGDDRDQSAEMIARFRSSGLSHLTAVSGQNIALLLSACGPVLRHLRAPARWAVTLLLIGWFAVLTRFEPSILRAGTMAALAATAQATGREHAPARTLGLAVAVLLVIDPLICWSVGFWLSVGATWGVAVVGPSLARGLARLRMLATPLGITLGAQLGVAVPSVLVFGRLPLVSVPANLLAVPVAGFVMLYGLPAGVLAGWVPALAPVVMWPAQLGTRWVDTVAALGARLEPPGPWVVVGWIAIGLAVTVWCLVPPADDEAVD